jgi:hypothetical protein
VMLEGASARAALRRSRELVRGRGWPVFAILVNVWVRIGIVGLLLGLAARAAGGSFLVTWLVAVLASALTTPYAAHAMTVVYFRIAEPGRPVAPGLARKLTA